MPAVDTVAEHLFAVDTRLIEHDAVAIGRHVMNVMINELLVADIGQTVLVLDDLHHVTESGVHGALDYLLERLPPQLTVVIATRHDPPLALARLRARRELVELRLPELRFTVDEAALLLNQHLGLQLAPDQIAILHRRIEGWVTGLSLLAASLERMPTTEEQRHFLNGLAQTERYIFEYLAEEVLNREDPFVRMFLLETSILPELTPAACQAITGRADANLILDNLYRRNLFLLAQDTPDTGRSYRYHDLFREFLHDRLRREAPEWMRQLHHRAGLAESSPVRALQHYLAAERWQDAAQAIKGIAGQYVDEGAFGTVRSWLAALPETTLAGDPWLTYWAGICAWEFFELHQAQSLFERALDGFTVAGDALGRGEALLQLVIATSSSRAGEETRRLAEQALACPLPVHRRARLLLARAHALTLSGDWEAANDDLDLALQLAEQTHDPRVIWAVANGFRGSLGTLPGGVKRCEHLLQLLQPLVGDQPALHSTDVLKLAAFAHTWRGQWNAAIAACLSLHESNEQAGVAAWSSATFGAILPLCLSIRGETDEGGPVFRGPVPSPGTAQPLRAYPSLRDYHPSVLVRPHALAARQRSGGAGCPCSSYRAARRHLVQARGSHRAVAARADPPGRRALRGSRAGSAPGSSDSRPAALHGQLQQCPPPAGPPVSLDQPPGAGPGRIHPSAQRVRARGCAGLFDVGRQARDGSSAPAGASPQHEGGVCTAGAYPPGRADPG
ncbi:MAG TPA: hypothetical protein VLA19_19025 [Herpetosiphonaceae bacterium]|nr:hypothetical protein [Herpetosiphonaceae bacterium]